MNAKFDRIWNDFHLEFERFIVKKVKDDQVAKDILQDVFIKIHLNISTLKDSSKLSSWIYRIAQNVITDYFRSRQSFADLNANSIEEVGFTDIESGIVDCVLPFVNQLDDKYKEAIWLTEFKGLSQKELALKLDLSYSGAKSRVQRAKSNLKSLFTDCCSIQCDVYGNILDYEVNSSIKNCCN